ncbi:MAG TPA: VWA domain-containing protein [Chloroflexota bacterium]|nr:VWA domain-containing protein [Chloroflexota bacterium]
MAVELATPWWLLVWPPLALLLVWARWPWWQAARRLPHPGRSRAMRQEGRRLALRLAWLSLLVLALAGASLARPLRQQAVVFVLDASASVAPVRDQAEGAVRTAAARLRPGDVAGVVATAGGASVEELPVAQPLFRRLAATLPAGASDLAAGLRLAGAILPRDYTGRVVLVSDGRQTRGDAAATARELAARGITVDVLPLGAATPDVRLEAVDLSEMAYEGETTTLTARLSAERATPATLRIHRDDQVILERAVELRPGRQDVAVPVPVGQPGLHRYRVELSAADPAADGTPLNNALGAVQRVTGPPRVLIVAAPPEAAGLLPAALQAGGAQVQLAHPSAVPADLASWARYDAVVLADVRADALPPGAMELLEAYVRDLGRGLVMTGGADSFGPGGYAETPVERTLPVYMDVRGRGRQPRVALLLIVDKSGSMSGAKMELAKEAAARSIRLLRAEDQAAVLAFDSVPQWVAPLTPVSQREQLERAIGSIYADGGTEIFPAVAAGFEAMRDVPADVKHIILLTDGMSGSGGAYASLMDQLRQARISLSSVAVGEDADTGLLQAMARAGRGRYHFAADPGAIPQIFTRETVMATRSILVDSRFFPAAASTGPLLRGLGAVPAVDGYVAVTPKERAEVTLVSPEGDPVLAAWQYGAGRAVAWTPDLGSRWSGAWTNHPAATGLWGNVLSWLLPPPDAGELTVSVQVQSEGTIAVEAENRSGWETVRQTHATLLGPGGQRQDLELTPVGPGRYRARLELPEPGAYVVQARQAVPGAGEIHGEAGWVAPYPAEYRDTGPDLPFLTRIAAAGGGRLLDDPTAAVTPLPRPAVARWPLWPLLLILAAATWPLEIASRRLTPPPEVAAWPAHLGQARTAARTVLAQRLAGAWRRAPGAPPAVTTADLASGTAQRLLERKRALRSRPSSRN